MIGETDIDRLAAAQRALIEEELERERPLPDLADVFARARLIDADAIPVGLHADVELEHEASIDASDDGTLDLFAAALREEVEADVDAQAMSPVRAPSPKPAKRAGALRWLAVAAVIALALLSLPRLLPQLAERDERPGPVVQPLSQDASESERPLRHREPPKREPAPRQPPASAPAVEVDNQEIVEPAPETEPTPRRASLEELEREASQRWRAGDLAEAERLLRQIIARGGKSTSAELAWGDLFAVTRQRSGPAAQAKAWRAYLRRFPDGRYADDAQGGLCRRSEPDARAACWRQYLTAHPQGAHVSRALKDLEEQAPQ